jgi:hypothetical protein
MTQERTDETDDAMVAPAVQPDAFGTLLSSCICWATRRFMRLFAPVNSCRKLFQQRKAVATRAAKARWNRPRVVEVK